MCWNSGRGGLAAGKPAINSKAYTTLLPLPPPPSPLPSFHNAPHNQTGTTCYHCATRNHPLTTRYHPITTHPITSCCHPLPTRYHPIPSAPLYSPVPDMWKSQDVNAVVGAGASDPGHWRNPDSRWYLRNLWASRIRAARCYDCGSNMVADQRSEDQLNLIPENAAGPATPVGIGNPSQPSH